MINLGGDGSFRLIYLGDRSIRVKNTEFTKKCFVLSFDQDNIKGLSHREEVIIIPLKSIGKIELYPPRRRK